MHEKQPLVFYVHCAAHYLNLVVNDAVSGVREVQDFFPLSRNCMNSLVTVYTQIGFVGIQQVTVSQAQRSHLRN